jgi:hypothetical protein
MHTPSNKMKGIFYTCLAVVLLLSLTSVVFAAKGGDDKGKKGYVLKFNGFEIKKTYLTPLTLIQQGATYKGTISPMQTPNGQPGTSHSIITYQKGNTIYIYPLQQKGMIQKFKTPEK